ncbi:transcription initiation factor IIB [Maublancomyces gigas]|uniref:Transcription initiation factor IIB n=1 Tax=Discina gigas TaxID=1032678 RepID=A0ABR3G818_9PEZI
MSDPMECKWAPNYEITLICKECKEYPANIIEDGATGDTICQSCGLVLGERMVDIRPEWRTFDGDDDSGVDPNRCGDAASSLLEGNQLDTAIAFSPGSAAGRGLARAHKKTIENATNKALLEAYSNISVYCESMGLTQTVSSVAKGYFKMAFVSKAVKGKDTVATIASCIFLACRRCGLARTFHEVMTITDCSKKELARTFKILSKLFQDDEAEKEAALKEAGASITQTGSLIMTSLGTAEAMIPRVCSQLGLDHKCQQISVKLMREIQRHETLGARSPNTIVGAVIYFVSHLVRDRRSCGAISDQCGAASETIRGAYRTLYEHREKLVDSEWVLNGMASLPQEAR